MLNIKKLNYEWQIYGIFNMEGRDNMKKTTVLTTLFILLFSCICPTISVWAKDNTDTHIEKIEWEKSHIYSGDTIDLIVIFKDGVIKKGDKEFIELPKELKYQINKSVDNENIHYQVKKNKLTIQFKKDYAKDSLKVPLIVSSDKNQICSTDFGVNKEKSELDVEIRRDDTKDNSQISKSSSSSTTEEISTDMSHETSKSNENNNSTTTKVSSYYSSSTSSKAATSSTTVDTSSTNLSKVKSTGDASTKSTEKNRERSKVLPGKYIKLESQRCPSCRGLHRQSRMSLNSSDVVNRIDVEPSNTVYDGEDVNLKVYLSEKYDGQIQPGDTITIQFPHTDKLSLTGYEVHDDQGSDGLPIIDTFGDIIGRLTVSSHQAVIKFNENVIGKSNIRGEINIKCLARNFNEASSQENVGKLTTNFGISTLPKQTITIIKPAYTPGENPFYYKTGQISPNDTGHVRWWLTGNMNKEAVFSDIYIVDEIQPGQVMDWNSFQVSFNGGYLDGQTLSLQEIQNKGIGAVYRLGPNRFVIRLFSPYVQFAQFTVTYLTKITDQNQAQFQNKSTIYYQTMTENHLFDGYHSDMTVNNIHDSGSADDDKYSHLELVKVDSQNKKALAGAEFSLVNQSTHKKYVSRTDKNGNIQWNKLPHGNYTLQEIKAPNGYVLNKTIYQLTVNKEGVQIKNQNHYVTTAGHKITVTNDKKVVGTPRLPETGGSGLGVVLILGGTVVAVAMILKRKFI